jgi:subtilase family serine protease
MKELAMRLRRCYQIAIAAALASVLLAPAGATAATSTTSAAIMPQTIVGPLVGKARAQPPSSADCTAALAQSGIVGTCYSPQDIRNEYDLNPLYARGVQGQGQTIVIFDSFGSPTIASDLHYFDQQYGLPDPPSLKVYEPEGHVVLNYDKLPSPVGFHNKNIGTEIGWAYETTLDVEWSHVIAPAANIALVVTPNAETQGVQGIPNMQNAQQWVLDHHIGTIWSNSWATTEQAFHTPSSIQVLNSFYANAASQGVSAFFATGDSGVANADKQGRLFPFPTVTFPSSSPNVVAVGGTQIAVAPAITSYLPEAVWNDCCGAGGGGYSSVFTEPSFEALAGIPDATGARGTPDISWNSAIVSSVLIYESFDPSGAGWAIIGGTSSATPQWAAVDALANQADGPLGFLTPRLYQLYTNGSYSSAFHDITVGDNSWAGIPGYAATPGWDAATGLGTPDATGLVDALTTTH